jgi:hypothetical protein
MVSTHPVDPAAGRSGRGAQIEVTSSGGVITKARTEEELPHRELAAIDVAAHQVRIHGFKCGG